MKVYLATDHGGFYLKQELKSYLDKEGHKVVDIGNTVYQKDDDYPEFILKLAEEVAKDKSSLGIVLGRSGVGEAIAANKVAGIWAALCQSPALAQKAREHNNINVLSLGADFTNPTTAKKIVDSFLKTRFSKASRHKRRLDSIKKYETNHIKRS